MQQRNTLLHHAVCSQVSDDATMDLVKFYLKLGLNPQKPNLQEETALMLATVAEKQDTEEVLRDILCEAQVLMCVYTCVWAYILV
jgi:hypothetical protein